MTSDIPIKKHNNYQCDILNLSVEEQNQKLVEDNYFEIYNTVLGCVNINNQDIPEDNSGLPRSGKIQAEFYISPDTIKQTVEPVQSLSVDIFIFFEKSLQRIIKSAVFSERLRLDQRLATVEESNKRKVAYDYFKALYGSFEVNNIIMNNFIKDLPPGVDNTNLLSSTWLLDNDFKNRMFKNNRTIILLYLYCREELKKPNVHLDFELIGQFVLFSSRRNFMIELNEIYDFEQNHPYTERITKGLLFENHTDLFKNECTFNWTIEILLNENELANKFCSTLALVLKTEKAFNPSAKYSDFCNFLNQSFNTNFNKLRPDEVDRYKPGQTDFKKLISDLNSLIEKKN